jgi:hypothetical protein
MNINLDANNTPKKGNIVRREISPTGRDRSFDEASFTLVSF